MFFYLFLCFMLFYSNYFIIFCFVYFNILYFILFDDAMNRCTSDPSSINYSFPFLLFHFINTLPPILFIFPHYLLFILIFIVFLHLFIFLLFSICFFYFFIVFFHLFFIFIFFYWFIFSQSNRFPRYFSSQQFWNQLIIRNTGNG